VPPFVKGVLIDAPTSVVFGFHEREDALSLLTPAFPRVRVIRRTGGIAPGARVELRIGMFSWVALHTAYGKDRLFVDKQIQGPFAYWVHRHEFEDVSGKTRLTDRVEYELPGRPLTNFLFGWIVKQGLINMFNHRHRVTKKVCERSQTKGHKPSR
jgi:ligand-binding SRPBCC domain-containing protein